MAENGPKHPVLARAAHLPKDTLRTSACPKPRVTHRHAPDRRERTQGRRSPGDLGARPQACGVPDLQACALGPGDQRREADSLCTWMTISPAPWRARGPHDIRIPVRGASHDIGTMRPRRLEGLPASSPLPAISGLTGAARTPWAGASRRCGSCPRGRKVDSFPRSP